MDLFNDKSLKSKIQWKCKQHVLKVQILESSRYLFCFGRGLIVGFWGLRTHIILGWYKTIYTHHSYYQSNACYVISSCWKSKTVEVSLVSFENLETTVVTTDLSRSSNPVTVWGNVLPQSAEPADSLFPCSAAVGFTDLSTVLFVSVWLIHILSFFLLQVFPSKQRAGLWSLPGESHFSAWVGYVATTSSQLSFLQAVTSRHDLCCWGTFFFFFIKLYIVVRGSFMLEPSNQGNSTCRCHAWQLKRFGDWTYLGIGMNK